MTCRTTALSYTTTTLARVTYPNIDDAQVQSIFHSLKREGKDLNIETPRHDEWRNGLDQVKWKIRNDETLPARMKQKLLLRLDESYNTPVPNGDLWYASMNISNATGVASAQIASIINNVAEHLNAEPSEVETLYEKWRNDAGEHYQDYPAPHPRYRYDLIPGLPQDKKTAMALRKLGYEHYLAEPLPVFVYGTLRTGQGNSSLMESAKKHTLPAKVHGIAIYGSGYRFPYAAEIDDPSSRTIGEIVWLANDKEGEEARLRLDYLEGFDSDYPSSSHYERIRKTVHYEENGQPQKQEAWMYVARNTSPGALSEHNRIPHGDWVAEQEKIFRKQYLT